MPAGSRGTLMHPSTELSMCALVAPMPIITMARLRRLMAEEGWPVDLARMCIDTDYAYECLALAHTSGNERLRHAAVELFASWDNHVASMPVH